ncbi:hypothetical protein EDC01DRAFT_629674 [Geopyxis carbonaria]|nr:hypothetical protein EDC01DRAFT_629674 [Geopyxis carbonaria]
MPKGYFSSTGNINYYYTPEKLTVDRSLILFASSWSLSPVWWKNQRVKTIQGNDFANLLVMNVTILASIGMGSVFLVLTLMHVISVHREARGGTIVRLSKTYDVVEFWPREEEDDEAEKNTSGSFMKLGKRSDSGLIARIVLAFVMVEGLSIYMIVMQIFYLQRWAHFKNEWRQGLSEPDIDQAEQFANLCSPIPGSLTGYLFLLVFGTTAGSRAQTKRVFRTVFCYYSRKTGYQDLAEDNVEQQLNFKPFVCPRPPRPDTCVLLGDNSSTLAGTTTDSGSVNTDSTAAARVDVPALRSSPTLGGVAALTITLPIPAASVTEFYRYTRSSIAEGFDFEFPPSHMHFPHKPVSEY